MAHPNARRLVTGKDPLGHVLHRINARCRICAQAVVFDFGTAVVMTFRVRQYITGPKSKLISL
jgi:hypothetical protein